MAVPRRLRDQFKEFLEEQGEDVDIDIASLSQSDQSVVYATGVGEYFSTAYSISNYDDLGDAVNQAHDDIVAGRGYGTIWLPPTDETFSTQIQISGDYISLRGQGQAATRPQYTGTGAAILFDGADRGHHGQFGLHGDGTAGVNLIELTTVNEPISHTSFQDIYLEDAGQYAIIENLDSGNDIYDVLYQNIYINGSGSHAFYSPGAAGAGAASRTLFNIQSMTAAIGGDFIHDTSAGIHKRYFSCEAEPSVAGKGYHIQDGTGQVMIGCRAEDCGDDGFYFRNINYATLRSLISWSNGGMGYNFFGDYTHNSIGPLFEDGNNVGTGIFFGGAGTVENNEVGWTSSRDSSFSRVTNDKKTGRVGKSVGGVTADRTIAANENYVQADTTGNAVTLTLATPEFEDLGRTVDISDEGGNAAVNAITVATAGAETIDGAASITINSNYSGERLVWGSGDWFTV